MTRAELEMKLLGILRNEKPTVGENLAHDTPLADAGIDSLDALTILFAVEEEFRIHIPDDRVRSMRTVDDMIDAVAAQLNIE